MKHNLSWILVALVILLSVSLACSLFNGGEAEQAVGDETQEQAVTAPSGPVSEAGEDEPAAPAQEEPNSFPATDIQLGEEVRSEAGGYAFKPVPDYQMEAMFGMTMLEASGADPENGPFIMLMGVVSEEEISNEQIQDEFLGDLESDTEIVIERTVWVDGKEGVLVELRGDDNGVEVIARALVVAITPFHEFTMVGVAPAQRADELRANFDAMASSLKFFEPTQAGFDFDLFEEEVPMEEVPEEQAPDMSGDMLPGEFQYIITNGTIYIIEAGNLQDLSTADEYIFSLSSSDGQHTLMLYLPRPISSNSLLNIVPYDENAAQKAPSASLTSGDEFYPFQEGMLIFEQVSDREMTGSFILLITDEDGNEINVVGSFNQIPLVNN